MDRRRSRIRLALAVCSLAASCGCAGTRARGPGGTAPAGGLPPDRAVFAEGLARYSLALSQEWNSEGAAAFSNFLRAAELDPDNEELQFRVALGLVREQRPGEARGLMERLAQRRPKSERAQVWAAFIHRITGQPDAAMGYYARALRANPAAPLPYLEKAAMLARMNRTAEAAEVLKAGLKRASDTTEIGQMLGELLTREVAGIPDRAAASRAAGEALRTIAPLVKREPGNDALSLQCALLYRIAGRYEDALITLEALDAAAPPENRWRLRTLSALFGEDDLPEARRAMESLVKADPDNAARWIRLGHLHEQAGDVESAEAAFTKARERAPDELAPVLRLGLLFTARQRVDEAVALFGEAAAAHPQDTRLLELLAYLELGRDKPEEALAFFDRAAEIFKATGASPMTAQFEVSHLLAGLQAGRLDETAARLQKAVDRDPDYLPFFVRIAARDPSPARREDGLKALRKLAELEPADAHVHVYWGLLASYTKSYTEALAAFARARELAGELEIQDEVLTPSFYYWYGAASERAGRIEDAAELFEKCIALAPAPAQRREFEAYVDALNYLAYMRAERGLELDRNLELIGKALEHRPDNPAYIDTRGWIHFMQGRYSEARDDIERALELLPDDPTITEHMGDIYEKFDILEEAVDWWKKSFLLDPASETVAEKLRRNGVDVDALRREAEAARQSETPAQTPLLLDAYGDDLEVEEEDGPEDDPDVP